MHKKLAVAIATRDGAVKPAFDGESLRSVGIANSPLHHVVHRGVFDDAAFAYLAGLQLELRFDEHQQRRTRFQQCSQCRQHQCLRDKRQVADDYIEAAAERAIDRPLKSDAVRSIIGTVQSNVKGIHSP